MPKIPRIRPASMFRRPSWVLVLLAVASPAVGWSQAPTPGESKPSAAPLSPSDARDVLRALQRIAESVRSENAEALEHKVTLDRPERTVTPPSIDSAGVDALLDGHLRDSGAEPAAPVDDTQFLRRATLDLTGKLPSPDEITSFAADAAADKRSKAIDRLLTSPDHARHWARYWRDVIQFRATFEQPRLVNYDGLEDWLADRFAEGAPWDEIARQLIAGQGRNDQDGQTAFAIAHSDGRQSVSPPEFAGEVSRIFLGVQIQCAQCHDHKTDPWTRRQFHEFAAFFAGTQAKRVGKAGDPDYHLEVVSSSEKVPRYGMPDLDDPKQLIPIEPRFTLVGDAENAATLTGLTAAERRDLAASLIVGQDNPYFAQAFVNRLWYELTGDAFVMPIDDLGPTRNPEAPEVLEALASEWQAGGYDIRWLFRTIMNTRVYQHASRDSMSSTAAASFAANCPSRLRADEIVAALQQALDLPDGFMQTPINRLLRRNPQGAPVAAKGALPRGLQATPERLLAVLFGVDPSTPDDEVLGTIPQALFLMNGQLIERALRSPEGAVSRILAENSDDASAIDAAYLRVLSRAPKDEERRVALEYMKQAGQRRAAFEDLYWALLNSSEFLSRR